MELKLTGPTAIVALLAIVAFGAYRTVAMQTELETEALDELKAYLAAEYSSEHVAAMHASLTSEQGLDDEEARARTDEILSAQNISFPSVNARGLWDATDGGQVVVKVEISVDGGPPPDGRSVRYYRMRYRPLSGWRVGSESSVWSYWLKLL